MPVFFKRIFDILFSMVFLVLIAPWFFLFISLLIKIDSKGSVFFVQERYGLNKQIFYLYKFRTLKNSRTNIKEYREVKNNDPRMTRFGQLLRRSGVDELPQMVNIMKGDMSLVGPRPQPVQMDNILSKNIPYYFERYRVKPGLCGWAQVNGSRGPAMKTEIMKRRLGLDLWYIKNQTLRLDIKIITMATEKAISKII